jgi:hypothetical protein
MGYAAMGLERQVSFSAMLLPCRRAPLRHSPLNSLKKQEQEHRENNRLKHYCPVWQLR